MTASDSNGLDYSSPHNTLLILYATQTGTAEDVAELLAREARRRGIASRAVSVDEYDVAKLPSEPFIVFVVATTGQGEEPDSMKVGNLTGVGRSR